MWLRSMGISVAACMVMASTALAQPAFRTADVETIFDGATGKAAADLDGDGRVDLLFPAGQAGTVSVFWGTDNGTFTEQFPTYDTGVQPLAAAVANFDGHIGDAGGLADIATMDSGTISVILGLGNRQFSSSPIITVADGLTSPNAAIATDFEGNPLDFNNDGFADLVVANGEEQGTVLVFYGNGDGSFQSAGDSLSTGQMTSAVVAADLNHDGHLDLVASNRNSNTLSIFIAQPDGTFGAGTTISGGEAPQGIAVGDFNEDGKLDVVVADRNADSFSYLAGNGNGTFAAAVAFSAGFQPADVAVADFDGDGHLDVAVANNLSQDVTVAYGDGKGDFPTRRQFLSDAGTIGVLAGWFFPHLMLDANNDGRPDAVTLNIVFQVASTYEVLLSRPGRTFQAAENVSTLSKPSALAVGDINSDGRPDMVLADQESAVTLITPGADGFSTRSFDVGGGSIGVWLADLNGDAHPDLIVLRDDRVVIALGDGHGGFGAKSEYMVSTASGGITAADFNEDGAMDIVVTEGDNGTIALLLGHGDGTFSGPTHFSVLPTSGPITDIFPLAVIAQDLDKDGHVDLAVASFVESGSLLLVYNQGDGTFGQCSGNSSHCNADSDCSNGQSCTGASQVVGLVAGRRTLAVQSIDADGDGIPDLLTANQDTTGMLLFRGLGGRNYATPQGFTTGDGTASALALRDIDGDGHRDALVASRASDRIFIHPYQSTSPFFNRFATQSCPQSGCLGTGPQPVAVAGADVDDNGTYDVLSVNSFSGTVTMNINTRASTLLRGDGNDDGKVSAADLVAVTRAVSASRGSAVEDAVLAGKVQPPTLAVDADGDGKLTATDAIGVAARLFR